MSAGYGLTLYAAPAFEPISLDQAKLHLKVEHGDDDPLIQSLIQAAREYVESFTGRRLVTQTWDLTLDRFPIGLCAIEPPYPPLQSVTSIVYTDTGGTSTTLSSANYTVDIKRECGRIFPVFSAIWPVTRWVRNAVTVRYVAGYGLPAAVPEGIKAAMKLIIGNWYENREAAITGTIISSVPMAVEHLLWSYRHLELVP